MTNMIWYLWQIWYKVFMTNMIRYFWQIWYGISDLSLPRVESRVASHAYIFPPQLVKQMLYKYNTTTKQILYNHRTNTKPIYHKYDKLIGLHLMLIFFLSIILNCLSGLLYPGITNTIQIQYKNTMQNADTSWWCTTMHKYITDILEIYYK